MKYLCRGYTRRIAQSVHRALSSLLVDMSLSSRLSALFAGFIVVALPLVTRAQEGDGGKLINPLKGEKNLWELVEWLVRDILVGIIAPIAVTLALLWSGFQFIMAQGNSDKLERARLNFLYVIIGAILLLGAYVILNVVTNTVNELTGK